MYAIFEAKGKQFRAEPDATIRLPSMDAEPGDRVTFERVLLGEREGDVRVGRPVLAGAAVEAEVVRHGKGEKVIVFKMKRRKNYRRKQGHRQPFTEIRIVDIDLGSGEPAAAEEPEPAAVAEPEPEEAAVSEPGAEPGAEPGVEEGQEAAGEVEITDAARELAEEHGIDVAGIEGTGKDGRILKSDVEAAVAKSEEAAVSEPVSEPGVEEGQEAAGEVEITDAARELAEEHGIDVAGIEGTGKDGRILKSDVEAEVRRQREQGGE